MMIMILLLIPHILEELYIFAHIEVMSGPTYLIYFRMYDMSKALNRDSGNAILKTQDKTASEIFHFAKNYKKGSPYCRDLIRLS